MSSPLTKEQIKQGIEQLAKNDSKYKPLADACKRQKPLETMEKMKHTSINELIVHLEG